MRKTCSFDKIVLLFIVMYSMLPSYLGTRVAGVLFNAQRAMTIVMILLLIAEAAANRYAIPRLIRVVTRARATASLLAVYLVFRFASAIQSSDFSLSINAALADILSSTVFLYLGIHYARDLKRLDTLIRTLVLAAAVLCVIGLVEAAFGRNLLATAFPGLEVSDDYYLRFALTSKVRDAHRVQSTFLHPLAFASYLVLVMPLAAYCMQRAKTLAGRGFYLGVTTLIAINASLTGSRAALLLIALISLVYWVRHSVRLLDARPDFKRAIGVASLGLAGLALVLAIPLARQLVAGKGEDEQASTAGRVVQLARGAQSVAEHPMLGVGPRMAGKYAGTYSGRDATVDNWYLTVVVESGVIALIGFCGSLASLLWLCGGLVHAHRRSRRLAGLFFSILLSVAAFSLFMVILSLHDETFPYLFLIMGAMLSMNDLSLAAARAAAGRGARLERALWRPPVSPDPGRSGARDTAPRPSRWQRNRGSYHP